MKTEEKSNGLRGLFAGFVLLFVVACFGLFSCNKDDDTKSGRMTLKMTDAPALYSQVNVDIVGAEIYRQNHGWVALHINQGVYNLLELQNNATVVLASGEQIPTGRISQLRLILGNGNTLMTLDGTVHSMKVPSGSQSGLKVNIDQDIHANDYIEVVLDFDANASVVVEGNGSYSLKPVIKVVSVNYLE
ncbi:MAG TPA: DUF4382 domain-containing protein [Flavobacteriales bacterium]|nr:DUF4382 domain-containing protein [Flavobacteriales bacterium]